MREPSWQARPPFSNPSLVQRYFSKQLNEDELHWFVIDVGDILSEFKNVLHQYLDDKISGDALDTFHQSKVEDISLIDAYASHFCSDEKKIYDDFSTSLGLYQPDPEMRAREVLLIGDEKLKEDALRLLRALESVPLPEEITQ